MIAHLGRRRSNPALGTGNSRPPRSQMKERPNQRPNCAAQRHPMQRREQPRENQPQTAQGSGQRRQRRGSAKKKHLQR